MKVINISVLTDKIIRLGRRGEGNVRQIVFDCTRFEETYGSGTAQLLHWRRGDEAPYPVLIEQNDNDVKAYLYNFQKTRNVSNRTLDSVRSVLSSFFSWASAEGYLEKNIMISVKPIKYRRKQRGSLDDYELEKLRSACETIRDEALVEFLYSTGCRVSELVNVNKEDVNIKDGEVTLIGKGDKERKSYLTAHASLALQEYLKSRDDDNNALFVSKVKPHNRLKKGAIEKIIGELGVKAGIEKKVYPHLIRHTTATMGLQHGMDVTEIQKMLGHANIETTMIYAEVNQNDVKTSHKKYII